MTTQGSIPFDTFSGSGNVILQFLGAGTLFPHCYAPVLLPAQCMHLFGELLVFSLLERGFKLERKKVKIIKKTDGERIQIGMREPKLKGKSHFKNKEWLISTAQEPNSHRNCHYSSQASVHSSQNANQKG